MCSPSQCKYIQLPHSCANRQPLEPETAEVVARLIIKLAACTLGTCLGVGGAGLRGHERSHDGKGTVQM